MRRLAASFLILLLLLCDLSVFAQRGGGYRPPPTYRPPVRSGGGGFNSGAARPTVPRITRPPRSLDPSRRSSVTGRPANPSGGRTATNRAGATGNSSFKALVPPPKSPEVTVAKSAAKTKLTQLRGLRATIAAAKARRAAGGGEGGGKPPKPPGDGANDNEPPNNSPRRLEWNEISGMLRQAATGKGNFGIGKGTRKDAEDMGKDWVGEGYTVASDGKTLISRDGLRQYRPPTFKKTREQTQANFERKLNRSQKKWHSNAHLDIVD